MHAAVSHINIELAGSLLLLLSAVLLAVVLTIYVYRRTNPVVSNLMRRTLLCLRVCCLVAVLLLLFQPLATLVVSFEDKPVLPVLVDQSASMGLVDESGYRPAQVQAVLSNERLLSLAKLARMPRYGFSTQLGGELPGGRDSLRFEGLGTNVEAALGELRQRLRGQPLAGVVVVTDGAANLGERLARVGEESPVPLFPVAVGSSKPQQDVIVRSVITNEVAYVGTEVPVDVRLVNQGFAGERVTVELRKEGVVLDARTVQLEAREPETRLSLRFRPQQPGVHRYVVAASHLPGEQTHENNRAEFVIRTLPGKMKVVVVAGRPSHDVVFISRALEADLSVELRLYVCRGEDRFYRAPQQGLAQALREADCLFLLDFPAVDTGPTVVEAVVQSVRMRALPLFWAAGGDLDFSRLDQLWHYLPLRGAPRLGPAEMRSVLLPLGPGHPLLAVRETASAATAAWQELPPVPSRFYDVPLWPNSTVLALGEPTPRGSGPRVPLLVARDTPESKSVALLASGYWRWDLMMWGVGADNSAYVAFVQNLVRWLSLRQEQKQLRISTDRQLYRSGEPVVFAAQVYTADLRPQEGAKVRVHLHGPGGSELVTLEETGGGRYEGKVIAGADGDYEFVASAVSPLGETLADTGRLSVTRWSVEFLHTTAQPEELRQMAERSGGVLSSWDDLSPLLERVVLKPVRKQNQFQFRYWTSRTVLVLLIAVLGTEWFLRRRKGMV